MPGNHLVRLPFLQTYSACVPSGCRRIQHVSAEVRDKWNNSHIMSYCYAVTSSVHEGWRKSAFPHKSQQMRLIKDRWLSNIKAHLPTQDNCLLAPRTQQVTQVKIRTIHTVFSTMGHILSVEWVLWSLLKLLSASESKLTCLFRGSFLTPFPVKINKKKRVIRNYEFSLGVCWHKMSIFCLLVMSMCQ